MKICGPFDPALVVKSGLFDPEWYKDTYPDVAVSGLKPITHFIRFGLTLDRDPGPEFCSTFYRHTHTPEELEGTWPLLHQLHHPTSKPADDLVLQAAMEVLRQGRSEYALALAQQHLPRRLQHTLAAVEANIALHSNDCSAWLQAVNRYLCFYHLAPLILSPAKQLLDQLSCASLPNVSDGPLVSVIVPVWNSEATLEAALNSLLAQTWRPLEVIAIDDASTDDSWTILQNIAARDSRVKLLQNTRNVGPYASKNLGLQQASGAYITGHDADDWAHPERIEAHMRIAIDRPNPLPVSMPYCLRMQPHGFFDHIRQAGLATSYDGWMQSAPIGTLFETSFLRNRLGYWDSVRFGADTEMLLRARHVLGRGPLEIPLMSMICLDAPHSLSNDKTDGTRAYSGGLSQTRRHYLSSVRDWYLQQPPDQPVRLDFPQKSSRYKVSKSMHVPYADMIRNIAHNRS